MTTEAAIATSALDSTGKNASQHESSKTEHEAITAKPTPLSASTFPNPNGQTTTSPIASTSALKLDTHVNDSKTAPGPANVDAGTIDKTQNITLRHDQKEPSTERDEDALLLASLASSPLDENAFGMTSQAIRDDKMLSPIKEEDPFSLPPALNPAYEVSLEPIQAYAKLEFPGFSYYIQTLECTIGRRPAHMRTPSGRDGDSQHITGATKQEGDVDVDLGLLKSISRLHVRIFYQEQLQGVSSYPSGMFDYGADYAERSNRGRFVLQVLGRNGCFVDDVPVGKDVIVPLGKRTKIQIAERVFYFVLPPPPSKRRYNSDGELDSNASLHDSDEEDDEDGLDEEDESGSLGTSEDEGENTSQSSEDIEEEVISNEKVVLKPDVDTKSKARPRLVLKKKVAPVPKGGKGKHQGKTVWPGQGKSIAEKRMRDDAEEEKRELSDDDVTKEGQVRKSSNKKAKVSAEDKDASVAPPKKRKRGDQGDDESKEPLKLGTSIGVEAISEKKKRRRKKKEDAEDAAADNEVKASTPAAPAGRGKSGGKALIAANAMAARAKAEEEKARKGVALSANSVIDSSIRPRPIASNALASSPRPPLATSNPQAGIARPAGPLPRPPVPANTTPNRPLPVSTPSNAYRASLSNQRPPSLSAATVPRPLSNGVAPSTNYSPTPAPHASTTGPSLVTPSSQMSAMPPASTSTSTPTSLPPAGPGIKPELSNMDLIRNALANPISMSRGCKLTLQEIYEDISSRYEWYRNNSRSNGRDWHSTMRHAVGNSKEMIKIPRKANEQGKGVFYAFKSSPAAQMYKKETELAGTSVDQLIKMSASPTPPQGTPRPASSIPSAPVNTSTPTKLTNSINSNRPVQSQSAGPSTPVRPRPPVQVSTRPSPPVQTTGRVSIVIGKAPAEALAHMALTPKAPITVNIEALFGGPPIVHHEGKLYLSPLVFGHMSASEINDIGGKGAQQALAILQSHLVSHLQGKMKSAGSPAPKAGGAASKGQTISKPDTSVKATAASPRPALSAPSLQQRPRPSQNVVTASSAAPATQRPPAQSSTIRPAQQGVASARPPTNARPMSKNSTQVRPATNGNPIRPAVAGASSAPRPVSNPARPLVRPSAPAARPPQGQSLAPTTSNARPIANGARPVVQISASRNQSAIPANNARPVVSSSTPRPSLHNVASSIARPSMPSVSVPKAPSPRPAATVNPSSKATTADTESKTAPLAGSVASSSAAIGPSSSAMMNAMQTLASHPDAAGLMALLSGGKVDSTSKLTPGQLDLLQQAGRLAAEQQKVQQQQQQKTTTEASSDSSIQATPKSIAPSKDTVTKISSHDDTKVDDAT